MFESKKQKYSVYTLVASLAQKRSWKKCFIVFHSLFLDDNYLFLRIRLALVTLFHYFYPIHSSDEDLRSECTRISWKIFIGTESPCFRLFTWYMIINLARKWQIEIKIEAHRNKNTKQIRLHVNFCWSNARKVHKDSTEMSFINSLKKCTI